MNIQAEKLKLIEWIAQLNDTNVIQKLSAIKESYFGSKDWRNELTKEEKDSIDRGLKDIEEGKVHSHAAARSLYEKYL